MGQVWYVTVTIPDLCPLTNVHCFYLFHYLFIGWVISLFIQNSNKVANSGKSRSDVEFLGV